jgi:hypothetical protein
MNANTEPPQWNTEPVDREPRLDPVEHIAHRLLARFGLHPHPTDR